MTQHPLHKACIGARCEKKERCYLFEEHPKDPFNCISPMDRHEECPYFFPRQHSWGDGPLEDND